MLNTEGGIPELLDPVLAKPSFKLFVIPPRERNN